MCLLNEKLLVHNGTKGRHGAQIQKEGKGREFSAVPQWQCLKKTNVHK